MANQTSRKADRSHRSRYASESGSVLFWNIAAVFEVEGRLARFDERTEGKDLDARDEWRENKAWETSFRGGRRSGDGHNLDGSHGSGRK